MVQVVVTTVTVRVMRRDLPLLWLSSWYVSLEDGSSPDEAR